MALRNIVTVGDPVLSKVCRPVTKFDDRLSQLIDDMIETLHDANGAGLAAPQIGVLRRVVIVNTEGRQVGTGHAPGIREGTCAGPARRLV